MVSYIIVTIMMVTILQGTSSLYADAARIKRARVANYETDEMEPNSEDIGNMAVNEDDDYDADLGETTILQDAFLEAQIKNDAEAQIFLNLFRNIHDVIRSKGTKILQELPIILKRLCNHHFSLFCKAATNLIVKELNKARARVRIFCKTHRNICMAIRKFIDCWQNNSVCKILH